MEDIINEYIAEYKKGVLKTIKEFGHIPDLKKVEEMAQDRKNKIINSFDDGMDVSRGLLAEIVKPVDIIKKDGDFYFVVILRKKEYLYDVNLFR